MVKKCDHLRALGTRHSFNAIADSKYNQVSLKKLDQITLDEKARTVTVGAGVRYGDLATVIDKRGYAVHNLASLPHISVAGACSTGTHGSGLHNGNLATVVSGLEIVTADGALAHLTREKGDPRFEAWPVASGRAGRRHQRDARRAAHVPGGAVRLPEFFLRSPQGSSRGSIFGAATA